VSANDSDSGVNGKVLYSITSQPQPAKFSINSNGVIFASSSVDRESSDTDEVSERYTVRRTVDTRYYFIVYGIV